MIVRQERPDDDGELVGFTMLSYVAVAQFGFGSARALGFASPDPRLPDAAWMALPLAGWDPAVAAPVVYPGFFPPPPDA